MPIGVAIIDDDSAFRKSLVAIFSGTHGFRCAGSYPNAARALERIAEDAPDVILLDVRLPGVSGNDSLPDLKRKCPKASIVMLACVNSDGAIVEAIKRGALGYVLKREGPLSIVQAAADVVAGRSPMSPEVARQVFLELARDHKPRTSGSKLTESETEILRLLARGLRSKEIASKLGIGTQSVHNKIQDIYRVLQVRTCAQAVAVYLGAGHQT
jgi:DNA-binding NarL/FixJ family response regulator